MLKTDHLVGQVIGGYRISFELPSQNTRLLYLGESETEPGKQVTLKFVANHPISSQSDQELFLHEARIIQQLAHPQIVPLLDYGCTQGLPYIVTPHTSWRPLATHLRRFHWSAPFALPKTLQLLWQLGEALLYAHQHHVIHGQLTPRCVLLDDQQRPLLTDFRFHSLEAGEAAQQSLQSESRFYLAPEQHTGQHKPESDQYALACIAYELLTGKRPAEAATSAKEGVMSLVAPSRLNPAVPPALDQALVKALSEAPEQRFGSLHEFLVAAGAQSSEETEIAQNPGMSQPEVSVAISSVAQAQPSQGIQQLSGQEIAVALPVAASTPQKEQTDEAHAQPVSEHKEAVPDHPLQQGQVLSALKRPMQEQRPTSQQARSLIKKVTQLQPRVPEPGKQIIVPPPPGTPAASEPAQPVTSASLAWLEQPMRGWLARKAHLVLLAMTLLIGLGSGMMLEATFDHLTRSTATTIQATTRSETADTQVTTRLTATDTSHSTPSVGTTAQATPQVAATNIALGKDTHLLGNPGFESGNASFWRPYNGAQVVKNNADSGNYAIQLAPNDSGVEQIVNGLTPRTTYVVCGWAKVTHAGDTVYVAGAKFYDGSGESVSINITSTTYQQGCSTFTTGANNTSADIYCYQYKSRGVAYCDDYSLSQL